MDKANLLKCLNYVKDNIDRADVWNKDVLFETIAYIETDGGATVPCSERLDATLLDDYTKIAKKTIESCSRIVITAKEDGEIDAKTASIILLHFLKLQNGI